MPTLHLSIEPELLGPVSVGTIDLIRLLQSRLALPLVMAKAYVDRCVFDEESVAIAVDSVSSAEARALEIRALVSPATFHVRVER